MKRLLPLCFICHLASSSLLGQTASHLASRLTDSVTVLADSNFIRGGTERWLLGNHYRKEWLTAVKVPILYLDTVDGDMRVIKEGGGKQTRSLRLELKTPEGRQMVLRSIEKFPERALPPEYAGTVAAYFLKDQISTAHPYGALVVPPLAEAAGVFHTNPKIVFLASSPGLKQYDTTYGKQLYLLEERSRSNWKDEPLFGYSSRVVSTESLLERLEKDARNRVDAGLFLRARLLDMLIGDWDRHEEQWDWASFAENNGTLFKPVPKDRDQAFVKLDGVAPWIATRKWLLRRIKHFDHQITDVEGLNWQARNLDRFLLNSLTWQDWEKEIDTLQKAWSDTVISMAVQQLPPELYPISGEEIKEKLISRRNAMNNSARRYYLSLAKEVRWVGTDDKDLFDVQLLSDSSFLIGQYRLGKNNRSFVKQRLFKAKETKMVALYGLGNDDVFSVSGPGRPDTRFQFVGGDGRNQYSNESNHRRINLYDSATYAGIQGSFGKVAHRYDPHTHGFRYDYFMYSEVIPVIFPGYNVDDGVYLGGGVQWKKRGWGYDFFSQEHSWAVNYAFKTKAYNFLYNGRFKKLVFHWDLILQARVNQPNYVLNFYGLGNDTKALTTDRRYHRVRVDQVFFSPGIERTWKEKHQLQFAGFLLSSKVQDWEGRFVTSANPLLDATDFRRIDWYGLNGSYVFTSLDNVLFPNKGFTGRIESAFGHSFGEQRNYTTHQASVGWFLPLGRVVWASRVGGGTVTGSPQFFQYNQLGGNENLRGFRRSRFSGKSSVFVNTELRIPVADLTGYILRGKLGILAFTDQGRVWHPNTPSGNWHTGYGGGVWFVPYGRLAFSITYGHSSEDNLLMVKSGFQF